MLTTTSCWPLLQNVDPFANHSAMPNTSHVRASAPILMLPRVWRIEQVRSNSDIGTVQILLHRFPFPQVAQWGE
jgi:hypothetical protein